MNQAAYACSLNLLSFPLDLLLNPNDGSSAFLRNVGGILPDYTALYPRRQYSS
jgi:hypothetical protein